MKAIKIDVVKKQVYYIDMDEGIESLHKELECETFTVPYILENDDALYVDDEGLLVTPDALKGAFAIKGSNQPYFGHGILEGTNDNGESIDVKSSLEEIQEKVVFLHEETMLVVYHHLTNSPIKIEMNEW